MALRRRAAWLIGGVALLLTAARPVAQTPASGLREAAPNEVWITQPTMAGAPPTPARDPRTLAAAAAADTTPPTSPGNLQVSIRGLSRLNASWSAASDPESGIDYYAFAIGTGTTPDTQADIRWWQSTATSTQASVNFNFTEGATYYFSVRANNGANLPSLVITSGPLVPARILYGESSNKMSYTLAPAGIDAGGAAGAGWPADRAAAFTSFLDKMIPVLTDLYGPPSTAYSVNIIRDLRYTATAVFFPSTDEIHAGDTVTYQLLTHEMIHAFRRDRVLSSGPQWQFDPTFSGFEEGFAQAISYKAMTEFARRYPSFGFAQQIYQSSMEWDYDFQNVSELRTTDFWSDYGGTLLAWTRYEVAAAAISKIEIEHPGFARAFNAEFYRRITADLTLTMSRTLIKSVVATVAPTIEGLAASAWIDRQYIFDCANHPGYKVWMFQQNYPTTDHYFIFNRTHFFETFANGSDWAIPDGSGGYIYYHLNGSAGTGTLRAFGGSSIWQKDLRISPIENPPVLFSIGSDEVNLTTQPTNLPWPGGDATKYVTNVLDFGLYTLTIAYTDTSTATGAATAVFRVIGSAARNMKGVVGGVVGATGGTLSLRHRTAGGESATGIVNGAFALQPSWASQPHPETNSNDTTPGLVDAVYVDHAGNRYVDVRTIGYGSAAGSQLFLFDVSKMRRTEPRLAVDSPTSGASVVRSLTVSGWATDLGAGQGTGVDAIHVYAFPLAGGVPGAGVFLGQATYGNARPDVGGIFGQQFVNSGFALTANLQPGAYRLVVYVRSTVTGTFSAERDVDVTVTGPVPRPAMAIDAPASGATAVGSLTVAGWAVDLGASIGTGVDAIHVWAFPTDGRPAQFIDQATLGGGRPDLAAIFGSQFANAGYNCLVTGLSPGVYDIGVFAHSSVTGTFNQSTFVRVTVK